MIKAENLKLGYGTNVVLEDVSVSIPRGTITTIIGANGCGKTTLFRTLSKKMKPMTGSVAVKDSDIFKMSNAVLAKTMSVLPQNPKAPGDYSVINLVSLGRTPHMGLLQRMTDEDYRIVHEAIAEVGLTHLQHRRLANLSGGERQRAWIAMCLAQQPEILLLDEPTTFLDISYQYEIMRLLKKLNQEKGITILMILHDLNQAIRYSDHIIALANGNVYDAGKPEKIMNRQLLKTVFQLDGDIITDPVNGCPMIVVKD